MKLYKLSQHERVINLDEKTNYIKNDNLSKSLYNTKCKIDSCNLKKWELSKKFHNDFEYVYTSSNTSKNMCNVVPISRSYFKLLEILHEFNLFKDNSVASCIAEGPGGFIQCIHDSYKKKNLKINNVYAITLVSDDKKVPYWNNNILNNKKNIILYGEDKTGNIYNLKNALQYIRNNKNKCYTVTSDGGFDFSENYNEQEKSSIQLLFCEIFIALNVQEISGNFIIKMFDILNIKTIQLLYILYLHYEEIYFYKPDTSRTSNSEKYIVCKNFKGLNTDINNMMYKSYENLDTFELFVPESFLQDLNHFNTNFINNQIQNINNVLKIVKTNRHRQNKPTKKQIQIAKQWCLKYNLEINLDFIFS